MMLVPDAAQHERQRSGAPLIRDRQNPEMVPGLQRIAGALRCARERRHQCNASAGTSSSGSSPVSCSVRRSSLAWKPSSPHISSIVAFSASTWPCTVLKALVLGAGDHVLHHQPAEPVALQLRAHENRELGRFRRSGSSCRRTTPSMRPVCSSMAMKAIAWAGS